MRLWKRSPRVEHLVVRICHSRKFAPQITNLHREYGNISKVPFVFHRERFWMVLVPRMASRIVVYALSGAVLMRAADPPTFEKTVAPVFISTCKGCHNESLASGSLDIVPFTKAGSLTGESGSLGSHSSQSAPGEMPPKGIPRPAALDSAVQFLQSEFEKADRNTKPDPGRVTARRLNRAEYSNSIRDLLGVEFRA